MRFIVTITLGKTTENYEVEGETPYQVKVEAALQFIRKYKIPGRPYHLLRGGNISIQSKEDKRIKYEI